MWKKLNSEHVLVPIYFFFSVNRLVNRSVIVRFILGSIKLLKSI